MLKEMISMVKPFIGQPQQTVRAKCDIVNSAGSKRKVTPTFDNSSGPDKRRKKISPYHLRLSAMSECQRASSTATGDDAVILLNPEKSLGHILELIPGKLEECGCEKAHQLTEHQRTHLLSTLLLEEVDTYFFGLNVKKSVLTKRREIVEDMDGLMPDHLYRTIDKWIFQADTTIGLIQDLIVLQRRRHPGCASSPMVITTALIFAVATKHKMLLNVGDPNKNYKLYTSLSKLLHRLLEFSDDELGIIDPYTRENLKQFVWYITKDWKVQGSGESGKSETLRTTSTIASGENKDGKRRANEAAQRKVVPANLDVNEDGKDGLAPENQVAQRKAVPVAASKNKNDIDGSVPANQASQLRVPSKSTVPKKTVTQSNSAPVVEYLNALGKGALALRSKTHVQLQIFSTDTKESCHVVVSGGMDLKNLGQLLAFLTGHANEYNWHSQKGKSLKNSSFIVTLGEGEKLGLGDKKQVKDMPKTNGFEGLLDKSVKICQIYQGLTTGLETSIVYDSEKAKLAELYWASGASGPNCVSGLYKICCAGIVANKCVGGNKQPLPRAVNENVGMTGNNKMAFSGRFLYKTNNVLRGDRNFAAERYLCSPSKSSSLKMANESAAKPIVNWDDGSAVESGREITYIDRGLFSSGLVASAGMPPLR